MVSDDMLMNRLVLKGGNALDLVLKISTRASVDLDFSMADSFLPGQLEDVRQRIEKRLIQVFSEEGFIVFDVTLTEKPPKLSEELVKFWGGYELNFKLVTKLFHDAHAGDVESLRRNALEVAPGQRTKFEIDISKHEFVGDKQQHDIDGYTVFVYSPNMLATEKLRAICQQMPEYGPVVKRTRLGSARARDFLDLKTIIDSCKIDLTDAANIATLVNVFNAKHVPLELLGKISGTREFHQQDWPSVEQTVKRGTKLASFDEYFDFVVSLANQLLAAAKPDGT